MHDVVIIGGSFAGLAAALQIARARRNVLVIDSKKPRNRFAAHSHGFLGQDGRSPATIMNDARAELLAYPTAHFIEGEVESVGGELDQFEVILKSGELLTARRLILATGMIDQLPDIPGLKERWGTSVLHCPYCHGYEVAGRKLGVFGNHPMSPHQAALIQDWGPTTYFTQGIYEPDEEQLANLTTRGIKIESTPIVQFLGMGTGLEAVRLKDGRILYLDAIFTATTLRFASPFAEQLGCEIDEGPLGPYLRVDNWKMTTVPGVYGAGDASNPMQNATLAAASGVMAGVGAHRSLIFGF
ncbi:NAD(P)/FAD-dependent oxidoreductase [bacterium]|nr:MAG: NAD(P)/FAD-dependent oxidoreductase [bacterium]